VEEQTEAAQGPGGLLRVPRGLHVKQFATQIQVATQQFSLLQMFIKNKHRAILEKKKYVFSTPSSCFYKAY